MIKLMRMVQTAAGTVLALFAIASGNIFICLAVYFGYFRR